MRQWEQTFRSVGREGLLDMGHKRSYDWDTKVAAARAVVDSGRAKPDVMRELGIAPRSPLDVWCRRYREGGAEALRPRGPRAGRKGPAPPGRRESSGSSARWRGSRPRSPT